MDNNSKITNKPKSWILIDVVVLYIIWSLLGVVMEGGYTKFFTGRWETHVVSMIAPLCAIYGGGAVLYYLVAPRMVDKKWFLRFFVYAVIGTGFELLCGLLLMYGLNMRAWDYTEDFMNYKGIICISMFVVWGLLGMGFGAIQPMNQKMLSKLHNKTCYVIAKVVAIVLIVDLLVTALSIVRWGKRVGSVPPITKIDRVIDNRYPNEYMEKRFVEWRFL